MTGWQGRPNPFKDFVFKLLAEFPRHIGDRFIVLLWNIWYHRNDIFWNNGPRDFTSVVRSASRTLSDWTDVCRLNLADLTPSAQLNPISWKPPREGFVKCNTDAATFDQSNGAGFGAVIRDSSGVFIVANATPFNSLPPVRECKARALRNAMHWVIALGFTHVVFEIDAKVVVDAIYDTSCDYFEFGDIIRDIRNFLLTHGNFSIHATRRQANEAAHVLARHSRLPSCPVIYHVIHCFLIPCITNNCFNTSSNGANVHHSGDGITEA